MLHNTDSAAGVAATSIPGLLYTILFYFVHLPIEKWVSGLTGIFIAMQMFFLLRDRMKKYRGKRGHE